MNLDKIDKVNKILKDSDLPNEAKSVIQMGAILGANSDIIINSAINLTNSELTKKAKNQEIPTPYYNSRTELIIHQMLKENTGVNMMDSGNNDGRYWQKNQKVYDFRLQDSKTYNLNDGYISVSNNVFRFLTEALEYEDQLTNIFNENKNKEYTDYQNMYDIADILNDHYNDLNFEEFHEFKLSGDSFNTYNYESNLSQVLQGQFFTEYEDTEYEQKYVILQIHNGADIRGGYTDCKVFSVDDDAWYNENYFSLSCDCFNDSFNSGDGDSYIKDQLPKAWKIIKKNRKKYSDKIYYCKDCKKRVEIY